MRSRRDLLAIVAAVVGGGCLRSEVTGSPPPHPQGSFEFAFETVDGTELARATATNVGEPIDPAVLRVRVGDDIAYADGRFADPYDASESYVDEWSDGVETDDILELTTGGDLPDERRLLVEVEREDDEYVVLGRTRTP